VSCWITHTNARTHEIIAANLDRSPMYSGLNDVERVQSVTGEPVLHLYFERYRAGDAAFPSSNKKPRIARL
jgi:hypothetical protein